MQEPREQFGESASGDVTGRTWAEAEERSTQEEVERRAARLRENAAERLRDAKARVGRAYDRTADQAARTYRGAREYAQQHPDVAAAVSFAVGVGVGMMMTARNGARAYRRGLVPVVAIALAQAVLDVFDEAR